MHERDIFLGALEIPPGARRQAYLDQHCAGNQDLRARIDNLIASHQLASQYLNIPVMDQIRGAEPTDKLGTVEIAQSPNDTAVEKPRDSGMPDGEEEETSQPDLSFLLPTQEPGSLGTLGHYQILQVLGQGAFGIVFKAFDEKLHRLVAIKALNPQVAATSPPRKRFIREARAVAALKHENIIQVYSVEEQPLPYLVMEYIDGQTLQQKLDGAGPLDTAEILHLAKQMAKGLEAAHARGLIHRDIKPGNILLEKGLEQTVKITDFGLARAADDASLTRTGVIAGTPMYMAPEQALGLALDHRADLFSLGSVLYQMASGRPPFRASSAIAVLKRVADENPRPIQEIIPESPPWLCAVIEKLQAKDPADRFQSARELTDLLGRYQAELQANGEIVSRVESNPPSRVATVQFESASAPADMAPPSVTDIPAQPSAAIRWTKSSWVLVGIATLLFGGFILGELSGYSILPGRRQNPDPLKDTKTMEPAVDAAILGEAKSWEGWPVDAPAPAMAPFNSEQARAHQEAWARYLGIPLEFTDGQKIKFILIPPGKFSLGSPPEQVKNLLANIPPAEHSIHALLGSESPQREAILPRPFYLGIREVTQEQYAAITGDNPSYFSKTGPGKDQVKDLDTARFPVEMVSWNNAVEFCNKLSLKEGLAPQYGKLGPLIFSLNGNGYRLPSETEWEFACRAGTTTLYWNGDMEQDGGQTGWTSTTANGKTHPVGELRANPFGLHDTHGNVWELVQDGWPTNHLGLTVNNYSGELKSPHNLESRRLVRGGSWLSDARLLCRSASRDTANSAFPSNMYGIRLALSVDGVRERLNGSKNQGPTTTVSIQATSSGFEIKSPFYTARINRNGQLNTLESDGVPLITLNGLHGDKGGLGWGKTVDHDLKGNSVTFRQGNDYQIQYAFKDKGFTIRIRVDAQAAARDAVDGKAFYFFHWVAFADGATRVSPDGALDAFQLPTETIQPCKEFVIDFASGKKMRISTSQGEAGFKYGGGDGRIWSNSHLSAEGDTELNVEIIQPEK